MMDASKIKNSLPEAELSEIRPCTAPGKVQFHLLVAGKKDLSKKALDVEKLSDLMSKDSRFTNVKFSKELSFAKAQYGEAEISALGSGRVVVRRAESEARAEKLLEALAPLLKEALF